MSDGEDIIKRFIELLTNAQPSFTEQMAADIERQLRHEYAGERVYIHKHNQNLNTLICARFSGNNTDKLARELRVSKRTIYRAIERNRRGA